jgi:hypothetical protein
MHSSINMRKRTMRLDLNLDREIYSAPINPNREMQIMEIV